MTSLMNRLALALSVVLPVIANAEQSKTKWRALGNPPFEIMKNNASGVEIQIGAMRGPKGAMGTLPISYSVTAPSGKEVIRDVALGSDLKITTSPEIYTETGAYRFSVDCLSGDLDGEDDFVNPDVSECWSQDVFIYSPAARAQLNSLRIESLAAEYAPVLMFAPDEQYFPASLAYILNKVDANSGLTNHQLVLRDASGGYGFKQTVRFGNLFDLIRVHGNQNYMIDMGYEGSLSVGGPSEMSSRFGERKARPDQKARVVIYYSVIPSHSDKNIVYLNYHTLYAYDSKGGDSAGSSGSTGIAGHAFDRESVTVKLSVSGNGNGNGNSVAPVSVIYGQHLADQTMAGLDQSGRVNFTWSGGAIEVPWKNVMKDGKHPQVAIARGSHAVYPKAGNYGVIFGGTPLLQEQAGGGDIVQPQNYELRDLGIMNYNPASDTSALSFSGYWVTIFFGKPDAKFPPFTDRETNPDEYTANAAKPGSTPGVPALTNW